MNRFKHRRGEVDLFGIAIILAIIAVGIGSFDDHHTRVTTCETRCRARQGKFMEQSVTGTYCVCENSDHEPFAVRREEKVR